MLYINNKEIYKYLYNWLYVSIDNYGTYFVFNFRHNITEIRSSDCIFCKFGKASRSKRAGTPINSLFWHNFLSGWFLNLWGKNDR